jgi:signal transduction histidine kinase
VLRDKADQHWITVRANLANGLPTVIADRVQLQQALMNLMLNGIEAMQDTAGELSVESQQAKDGQVVVSVADTGVGLPDGDADRIFDVFVSTKSQGTGLGLAITRSILKKAPSSFNSSGFK